MQKRPQSPEEPKLAPFQLQLSLGSFHNVCSAQWDHISLHPMSPRQPRVLAFLADSHVCQPSTQLSFIFVPCFKWTHVFLNCK